MTASDEGTRSTGRTWTGLHGAVVASTVCGTVPLVGLYCLGSVYGPLDLGARACGVGAAVLLTMPILLLAWAIRPPWYTRLAAVAATGGIILSQVLEMVPALVPGFTWKGDILNALLHVGIVLFGFAVYLLLFQVERLRVALAESLGHQAAYRRDAQEERDRLRQYLDVAGDLIGCIDRDGCFALLNRSGHALLGYDDGALVGKPFLENMIPERDREEVGQRFDQIMAGARPATGRFEQAVLTASGEERLVLWHSTLVHDAEGAVRGLLLSGADITELRRLEEEQRSLEQRAGRAERLESLGVLAGGIAHEFNNLLMSLLGNTELAQLEVPADSPAAERLAAVEAAAQRAARLTQEMLDYSGRGPMVLEPVDMTALVRRMAHLIKAAVGDRVEVIHDLAEGLPTVEVDRGQLRQAVMHLVTNAGEAMATHGGRLHLHTAAVDLDAPTVAALAPREALAPGRYVLFEVIDEGDGMDPDTREHAFDPFFSTRFTGRGLGLAAVLGTVRSHGGVVELDSAAGRGTCFRIYLPALVASEPRPVAAAPAAPVTPAWRGRRAVLLADDDPAVLEVGREYLELLGIPVLAATTGAEVLETLAASLDAVGCVVLDHQMPGLSSTETRDRIAALRPGLPVILSSGYGRDDLATRFDLSRFTGFLQKPYRSAELAETLREHMNANGA